MVISKANVVDLVCQALARDDRRGAAAIAREEYPFTAARNAARRYSEYQMTQLFTRDGFIDRYSGDRLVFPGTLRLLSTLMPEEFPAHPNWTKLDRLTPFSWSERLSTPQAETY